MVEGVRELKKRETRRRIAETALRLFAGRGFDAVTVAEVARAAGVTEKTVFNHFETKEDLVYSEDRAFEAELFTVSEVEHFESFVGTYSPIDFNGLVRHYYFRQRGHQADIRIGLAPKRKRVQQSHEIGLRIRNRRGVFPSRRYPAAGGHRRQQRCRG